MSRRLLPTLALNVMLWVVAPEAILAQAFEACYVPNVGALYLINRADLPADCLAASHVLVTWTEDGTGATDHGALIGLSDDDHPQYLLAGGVRDAADGFAVTGAFGSGVIPVEGAGVRLMWYLGKAALRAGEVEGTHWDDAQVGDHSIALGVNTIASGDQSVALGRETMASGLSATALGLETRATGVGATALGVVTEASGAQATAMGRQTTARGMFSTSMGRMSRAQARTSVAIGRWNVGSGDPDNWVDTDPLLVAGNGSGGGPSRSNALTLLKNGNMTIAGTLTESSDARLKTEVEPLESVLEALGSIRPVRFRFRDGTGHPAAPQIGLLAQEVQAVFPELVTRDAEGYLALAYPKLTAVLLKGMQEQQSRIREQKEALQALRARTERLEGRDERLADRLDRLQTMLERFRSTTDAQQR